MASYRNLFCWPVNCTKRSFRIYVVEPEAYSPERHAAIFNSALVSLLSPVISEVTGGRDSAPPLEVQPFDLVTFPEAFLKPDDLATALKSISGRNQFGCVHVGLRSPSNTQHLFSVTEIESLIQALKKISGVEPDDFLTIGTWISRQTRSNHFNLGCLFMLDARGKIRVCLHPKIIRSKFEVGMSHEHNMAEADMLTLVSLIPQDRKFLSITIQPLICSDGISGDTDRPGAAPIIAVNTDDGSGLNGWWPDHIDIVSLATCTPQPKYGDPQYLKWHQAFQDTFRRAAKDGDLLKHHHAVFALSNYRTLENGKAGGLSGAFIPVPYNVDDPVPEFLSVSAWGHQMEPKQEDCWSKPDEIRPGGDTWTSYGYLGYLRWTSGETSHRILGFTLNRLPRHASRWSTHRGLIDLQLFVAATLGDDAPLIFKQQD